MVVGCCKMPRAPARRVSTTIKKGDAQATPSNTPGACVVVRISPTTIFSRGKVRHTLLVGCKQFIRVGRVARVVASGVLSSNIAGSTISRREMINCTWAGTGLPVPTTASILLYVARRCTRRSTLRD